MKLMRNSVVVLLLVVMLISNGSKVNALNTGFSTESLSEDLVDKFLVNVNITLVADEPQKRAVECFDVSKDGRIAIGCGDSEIKTVSIYTSEGCFQYGYRFKCSGIFGVELHENMLIVYFVRSDVALAVSPEGKVLDVVKIQDTIENNSYWNRSVFAKTREVGDYEYVLRNDMGILNSFASSYSQLVVIDTSGVERIIYDVNTTHFQDMSTRVVSALVFICLIAVVVIWEIIRHYIRHKTD